MVTESLEVWPFPFFFFFLRGGGVFWRLEASLCVFAVRTRRLVLGHFLLPGSQRSRPRPRRASCLELSFVEDRTACSLNKQIPRCEPIRGCHVFPGEIPDLVCCVFLKTRPLPPKTSAGEEKHFSLNYQCLKWCQIMPHFHGVDTPVFPFTAFADRLRWLSVAII